MVAIAALASALPSAFAQTNSAPVIETIDQETVPSLEEFTARDTDRVSGEAAALQSPVGNDRNQVQFSSVDPHPQSLTLEDRNFEEDPLPSVVAIQESLIGQADPDVLETTPEGEDTAPLRINVTGEILDQPVFTPFRQEGTLRESSQPVYIINRQQMEAQGVRTVNEALRYLPGVISDGTTGGQLGALSGQFIRGGVTSQTLILLDGRPLNEVGAGGNFDLSTLTVDAVEQIEVLPGGGSVLYGSNAIGGVINIITRSALATDGLQISADAALGSFGFNDQVIQLRGTEGNGSWVLGYNRTSADNAFPFSLTSTDFDGTRRNADVLYNNVNLKLVGDIDDRNQLRFGLLYLSRDLGVPGGVPVPDSVSGGFNALTEDDRQYSQSWLMDVVYESALGQGDDSTLTARFYADLTDVSLTDSVADNPFETPTRQTTDQTSLGGQLQHAWQFASNQNITYGVDYRNVQADNIILDLLTDQRTLNYSDTINQLGLFARYQADFTPRFSANLGVRQDFNDLADGSFTSFSVGTRVKITDTTNFRANFARNFRVPTLGDLFFAPFNNPDLGPESGLSFDVGIDQQLGDRGLFRFTLYRNDIQDAISFDLATFTPQNIGRVESIGIETEVNYQLFDDWFVFANYTWNNPTIRSGPNPDNEGNLLPFTHADTWNVGLSYENPQGWYGALFLNSVSNFFVDRANEESLSGRTTLDFKLRVPITHALALNASVNNIFDTQYEEFPGFPGVGRNFQVGVRSTF
jgi:vitamin B12 transporter